MEKPLRIYISAMETKHPVDIGIDPRAVELLDVLREAGFDVYWEKNWREYEIIEREIEACDALLVILDTTWTSSTWTAHEFTWARGHSSMTGQTAIAPMPAFVYPTVDRWKWGLLKFRTDYTVLDREPITAVEQIAVLLQP